MARRLLTALAGLAAGLAMLGAAAPQRPDDSVILGDALAPKLSDYRLLGPGAAPLSGRLTPYDLATPLFTDYAVKRRYAYIPAGKAATYRAQGALEFPVGSVLIKTFAYPADFRRPRRDVRLIETRLLMRKAGGWVAAAYVWNAEGTDAVLKRAGARTEVSFVDRSGRSRTIDYGVPNQNQCKECHQLDKALAPIGPKARNLNGLYAYHGRDENQLTHWTRAGLLVGAPPSRQAPRTPRWDDPSESLEARARAYLDANCAHCHNPRAVASNSGLFLDLEELRPTQLGVGKGPVAAGRGAGNLKVGIEPGDPDASILAYRMASTEPGVMMPELGRSIVHDEGLALIRAWISEMKGH